MEYISNPITAEELSQLYHSELYQELLKEYQQNTSIEFTEIPDEEIISKLLQRKYLILNIPIEEVIEVLTTDKDKFIAYCIQRKEFYTNYIKENSEEVLQEDEEFYEEEALQEMVEDETYKTFLLHNFCEYYLLKNDNTERIIRFLKRTKMPFPIKHLSEIEEIYTLSQKQ